MRKHRLATLVAAAAMTAASALAAAAPAHAGTQGFELQSAYTFECLQPAGGSSGAVIYQATCNGSLVQQWTAPRSSSSSSAYHLVNLSTGLCLDARGGAADGTPIELWPCNWISNENWKFMGDLWLASGISGTYTYCISEVNGLFGTSLVDLARCGDLAWQAWYKPSP